MTPAATAAGHASQGWLELIEQSWAAVTAGDMLRGCAGIWSGEGLSVPSPEEAISLAAAGRLLRYGQSIHVSLPLNAEPTLPKLAFYLHRLRLDAASGLLRSPWLNPVTVAQRRDLLVFGRRRRMLRDFSTSTVMRARLVDGIHPLEGSVQQRTLLADGQGDLLLTLERLSQDSRPFAILVQATQQGCGESALGLIKVLPDFFPGVPIIVLSHTGQAWLEALPIHAWTMRLGDVDVLRYAARAQMRRPASIEVVAARDTDMDVFTQKLGFMVWSLRRKFEETGGAASELSALLALERTLRGLNVPLNVHEKGIQRYLRGGRFPVRTLESWLESAARLKGRRGDIQELHAQILAMVRSMMKQLVEARTGRGEAIVTLCAEALEKRHHVRLLVGGERDASILQRYLEERLGPAALERIAVAPMDGANAVPGEPVDVVMYAAALYPSRQQWLGLSAARKMVLCHPFEQAYVRRQVESWCDSYARPSNLVGDKQRLWSLQWPQKGCLADALVEDAATESPICTFRLLEIDGHYPRPLRVAQLESTRGMEDWLAALMAEPPAAPRDDARDVLPTPDVVVLHLEGQLEPVRWPVNRQILRLAGEELSVCPPREVQVGDELVLLISSDERVATQRDLFEMFVQDNHGLAQTARVAEKWQDFVDVSVEKFQSAADLNRHLKSKHFEVHNNTVQKWVQGGVIGPQDPSAIRLMAEAAGVSGASQMAGMVANAIQAIRNEHRRIGVDLRRAISLTRSRDVSAVQIGSRRFAREVFDGMVQVSRVMRVELPALDLDGPQQPKSIKEVAQDFGSRHTSQVIFTPACERSMVRSSYGDLRAFAHVLKVLVDGFHPMYAERSKSLRDVMEMLRVIPASYAGGMSDITKGKTDQAYSRLYEGQRVDISRHIKLGRAFDPRYTLRLHFHWDAERAKIVVHHAGEHLPTLSS